MVTRKNHTCKRMSKLIIFGRAEKLLKQEHCIPERSAHLRGVLDRKRFGRGCVR